MTGVLPGRWVDVLRNGDSSAYGGDRSRAGMALAVAYVNAGLGWADWHHDLKDVQNGAARWYRLDRHGKARDPEPRLRRDWSKAAALVAARPAVDGCGEGRQEVGLIVAAREAADWSGPSASSRLAILRCLHDLGTRIGDVIVRHSIRQISEGARLSTDTVKRQLPWLLNAGWLRCVAPSTTTTGTVYRLCTPAPLTYPTPGVGLQGAAVHSDAIEVLRAVDVRVLRLLHDEVPRTAAEVIAQPTAPARRTVYAALARLRGHGVAVQAADGTWTSRSAGLAVLDAEGAPRAEARRERNALERDGWLRHREQRALERRQRPRPAAPAEHHAEPAAASAPRPRRVSPRTPTTTSPTTRTLEMAP